ncbi:hypothetical protein PLEOSDRAFT_176495 [Pleurotus ostreatus PC15]|uniref:FAD-binding domain-containing protein n=1 Tax=Pleurotus ostreatus (strain PC15) TaxID=1137138 RepID=A0A067NSD7_PLEO1|nr:hypothetical protein PLEOSDRAFT_176495 [Pleurotus ostreatus PC15]
MVGINPADRDADGVSSEVPIQQSNRGELGSSLEASSSTPSTHSPPALVSTPSRNSTARFRDPSWMYHPTGQRFVEQEESPVRSWHMHSVQMNEARLRAKHTSSPPPTSRSASSYQSPKPTAEDEMNQRMRSLSINQRQANLTIDTIVIGGSIAGLATAYALSRVGHRVHVLEKAPSIDQRGIGIRIAPNCSKLLVEWGLGEELSRLAQKCRKSTFRDMNTSEVVGIVEWAEDIIQEAGGEFFLILYSDLRQLLYDLAVSNGVQVSLGAKVQSVSADDTKDQPTVTLEDGTILSADLIVGADGQNSTVREAISGVEPPATDSYDSYYSVVIPGDRMREDPELAEFPDLEEWPMWMGDMRVALAFGTRGGDKYCIHLYWPNKATTYDGPDDEGWETFCSPDVLDLSNCDPRLQKLYKMAEYCIRTKYVVRPPPDEWVHESGRMVLLGEAAHPLLPCSTQGAGMAIEDAAALGSLMSRLRTWDQLPMLLNAFQDLRRDRCMDVGLTELNNATLVTLPPGPTRDGRNAGFRQALALLQKAEENGERWSDAQLRDQWDEIGYVFAYNARDAAEDWWVEWGALGEGSKAMMMHDPLNLSFSIMTETSSAEPLATQIMAMG